MNANWLGDVLFSTPAIRALRKKYPESHIACLVPPRVVPVLKGNPHLNEILPYDDRVSFASPIECARVVLALRARRFDTALFFHRSKTKVILARLAGIGERIGYSAPGRDGHLTRAVAPPRTLLHKTDYFLRLLADVGVPADGRHPDFFPDPSVAGLLGAKLAGRGLAGGTRYAVVHAGGNWTLKRWPVAHFVQMIRLVSERLATRTVLCGGPGETALANEIRAHFGANEVISLCGETSLDELALLLKNASFVVSNDSGPLHLAASQRTPLVGLFGPTLPELTGPVSSGPVRVLRVDVGCEVPCYFRSCDHRVCMEYLTPGEVFRQVEELLHA
jgi:lipopolysaccharide heptosyltransferase II